MRRRSTRPLLAIETLTRLLRCRHLHRSPVAHRPFPTVPELQVAPRKRERVAASIREVAAIAGIDRATPTIRSITANGTTIGRLAPAATRRLSVRDSVTAKTDTEWAALEAMVVMAHPVEAALAVCWEPG